MREAMTDDRWNGMSVEQKLEWIREELKERRDSDLRAGMLIGELSARIVALERRG